MAEGTVDVEVRVTVEQSDQQRVTEDLRRHIANALRGARDEGLSYAGATRRAVDEFVRAAESAEVNGVASVEVVEVDRETGRIDFRVRLPPTPDDIVLDVEIPDEPGLTGRRAPGPPSNERARARWRAVGCRPGGERGERDIELAAGDDLDVLADANFGLVRGPRETDEALRRRLLRADGENV